MEMSQELNELFSALAKFQGELDNAKKGKSGHGYKYADLAECINTAKPFLTKHGLAVTQMLGNFDGKQTLITMMTHSSGQWMRSEFPMVEAVLQGGGGKNPAQQLGSAITYQRRYAYAAIIGLAQEDDDAAMLSRKQENKAKASFNYDGCLSDFTNKASGAKSVEELQSAFKAAYTALNGHPNQAKAKDVYDIRKSEIEIDLG